MQDILTLYQYIKNKYSNYKKIEYTETELIVVFHDEFEMKIKVRNYYNFYFNNIFYYNLYWQDVKEFIDDIFANQYAFCEKEKKLKIISLKDYKVNTSYVYNRVWTIERTLK